MSSASLARSGLIVASGLMLGRMLGFVREIGIAAQFGVTGMADAAILTLSLPDMVMTILCGGVLSAVLVPEFVRLGEQGAAVLHRRTSVMGAMAGSLVAGLTAVMSLPLAQLLAPGASTPSQQVIAHGIAWSAWLMPLVICATITTVWLQAMQRFGASAFATVFFNAVLVGVLWAGLPAADPLRALALAMLAAGTVRCLWLWSDARPFMNRAEPSGMDWPALRKRYVDALVASTALFVFPLIGRAIASGAGDGGLAIFNYASKLIELPLAIAITMVSTVVFAPLARQIQQGGDWSGLWANSQRLVVALAVIITMVTVTFSQSLADVAFGWGAMTPAGRHEIARQCSVGMLSLALQGMFGLNNLVLAAFHETRRMMLYSLTGLLVFGVSGHLLFRVAGGAGLMAALVLAYAVMVFLQCRWLVREKSVDILRIPDPAYLKVMAVIGAGSALFLLLVPRVLSPWVGLFGAVVQGLCLAAAAVMVHGELRGYLRHMLQRRAV